MERTNIFSGIKPALEDWNFERDTKELHIKKRLIDLTGGGTGIIRKVADELEVYIEDIHEEFVKVKTGQAYIQGEKIEIDEVQEVGLDDIGAEANIIYLKYLLQDSSNPDAVRRHYLTGQEHIVWQEDSFELIAVKQSLYVQTGDKLKLARVEKFEDIIKITHDYRTFLKISDQIMNTLIDGKQVLFRQLPPPIPTRLRLTTNFEQILRSSELAGLVSVRPAYIKAEFGDSGTGTASGNLFTKTTSKLTWSTNEWAGQYLTDQNNDSYLVISNTATVLTLQSGTTPVSGNFWLGPNARGYRFIIEPLHPDTQIPVSHEQAELCLTGSPVEMNYIFHGLTPDILYRVRVAALGGWYQEEQSSYCAPVEIIAGGPKIIPENCSEAITNLTAQAHDLGCKLTWDLQEPIAPHVAGVEICWTDDGTEPDFTNIGMRKMFTDRNFAILPSELSTTEFAIRVKVKMRCVDTAGRHCTNPLASAPIDMKQYPGDLSTLAATRTEVVRARDGYSELAARITAMSKAAVGWSYIRIVAKSGGHFQSHQAAIDSITEPDKYHIIYTMPGQYIENVNCGNKLIGIVGLGKVLVHGSIDGTKLYLVDNIRIKTTTDSTFAIRSGMRGTEGGRFLMEHTVIDATLINASTPSVIYLRDGSASTGFLIRDCAIYCPVAGVAGIKLYGPTMTAWLTGLVDSCRFHVANRGIYLVENTKATVMNSIFLTGTETPSIYVATPSIVRPYNNVWNEIPAGTGTIDYGSADSNIHNDLIEILLEDDMFSNET